MATEAELYQALKYHIVVDNYGTRWYYNNEGQLHCTDGPAIEYWNGTKCWYQNGLRHRTDGPAIECTNGDKFWYLYGDGYTEPEYYAALVQLGFQNDR